MFEKVPEDWEVIRLNDICKKIKAGGTPLTTEPQYWNGNIPFVKIEDVTTSGKYLTKTTSYISELGLKNSNSWLVPKNTLLLAMYGSLGEVTINRIPVATNQAILAIIPKDKEDLEFLYYWFLFFKSFWKKYAKSTTQANLTAEIVKNIHILYPKKKEERKAIARILSTVDEAIQKVDEIIAKTERLKKGLMQKLLTKGIGHKEFKNTEIGRIPKEWEVVRLGDVVEIRKNKKITGIKKIAFISMELIPDSEIFCKYEIRNKRDIKSSTYCEAGDLLLAKITPSLENGKQGIVPLDIPNKVALCTTEAFPINCKQIDKFFLFYLLKLPKFRNKIIASMTGTTGRQRASRDSVENLKVFLPSRLEQQKIVKILSTIDKKLELERKRKEKIERIKRGLMNDLLTGKKRVKL